MNEYLSNKLRVLSFISMIMVVFLHSYNATSNTGNALFHNDYNVFVQSFFSHGITRIAVPFFFLVSGYLFFLHIKGTSAAFMLQFKKRIKSLLAPYLLWSAWGLLLFLILQHLPVSRNFFSTDLISGYSFKEMLYKLFVDPIPYQLWFLRDLIVLVLFSPIIYWILKSFHIIPIVLLFIIWLGVFEFNYALIKSDSLFFFCCGAYFALNKSECLTKIITQKNYWILTCLWIIVVLIKTALMNHLEQALLLLLLHKISILLGLVSFWSMYDLLLPNNKSPHRLALQLSTFTFFLYTFHEPSLSVAKKGLFRILGANEITSIVIYFAAPILTIIVSFVLAYFLKKHLFPFYKVITGGR